MSYDVAIVGGGVLGSVTALRLAQRGARVVVLDRSLPGTEASSAAGGLLAAQLGAAQDGPLFRLGLRARAGWPAFAEEVERLAERPLGLQRCGAIAVAFDEAELHALHERLGWQAEAGFAAELLDGAAVRALEPALGPSVVGGVRLPDEAQLDAQALVEALPLAAAAVGVHYRHGDVRRVALEDGRAVGVESVEGTVPAKAVLIAAGAFTTRIEGSGLPLDAVGAVRGRLVRLRLRGASLRHVIVHARGAIVPRPGGEVLCTSALGGTGHDEQEGEGSQVAGLLPAALLAVPALRDAEVLTSRAASRPAPKDGLPLIGETPTPGLFVASGHHHDGFLLTPETGRLLTAAIRHEYPPELRPFSPLRFVGKG